MLKDAIGDRTGQQTMQSRLARRADNDSRYAVLRGISIDLHRGIANANRAHATDSRCFDLALRIGERGTGTRGKCRGNIRGRQESGAMAAHPRLNIEYVNLRSGDTALRSDCVLQSDTRRPGTVKGHEYLHRFLL